MIYAAYVGSDTGVSFARNAKQFLNLAAKADGATTRLEPVDGNSVWCVKQDCGGAYLLRVKRKKGGDCE